MDTREVRIPPLDLVGDLTMPEGAPTSGLVVFAHGSGSSRLSPRNRVVAEALNQSGMAILLFDLLTVEEEQRRENVFDIAMLAKRLVDTVRWVEQDPDTAELPLGLFGASTGSAAALVAAAELGDRVAAVVSRGGRPDLAEQWLPTVKSPTLLIVGGADYGVIELNQSAFDQLVAEKKLEIVPGATYLFPEPGGHSSG